MMMMMGENGTSGLLFGQFLGSDGGFLANDIDDDDDDNYGDDDNDEDYDTISCKL